MSSDDHRLTLVRSLSLPKRAAFYYFKKGHPIALEVNRKMLKKLKIPSFGLTDSLRAALLDPIGHAANLTASYNRFANAPHRDNDDRHFVTSGFWYTIRNGDPVTTEDWTSGRMKNLRGGNFYLPEFGILVDFSQTAGMNFVTWNGWKDLHCTTLCEGDQTMDRIGVSMQVAQRTTRGCDRYGAELGKIVSADDPAVIDELVDEFQAVVTVGNDLIASEGDGEVEVSNIRGRGRFSQRIAAQNKK